MAKQFWEDVSIYGDLSYVGTAKKIKGDFTNATPANRTAIQTTTVDGSTIVPVVPNGTGTVSATQWWGASGMINTHYGEVKIDGSQFTITSTKTGTGTTKPLWLLTENGLQMSFHPTKECIGLWSQPSIFDVVQQKHLYIPANTVRFGSAGSHYWTENAYYHATGPTWKYYSGSAKAGLMQVNSGDWSWWSAVSGTQDGNITWNHMVTFHDTGEVSIGSQSAGQKLDVNGACRALSYGGGGGQGAGAEMDYFSGEARFFGYDRANTIWKPAALFGDGVDIGPSGNRTLRLNASNKSVHLWNTTTEKGWEDSGTYRFKALVLGVSAGIGVRVLNSNYEGGTLYMMANCYFNGTAWKRIQATDSCTLFHLSNQVVQLRRAASGTADSDITWTQVLITDTSDNLTVTGNVTAYSDRRVKENVEVIQDAMGKVRQLSGLTYNRSDVENKPRQMGLIAQDVQKVVPEVVIHDEKEDRYSLAYGNMVALLVEAIKEQDERIRRLERELLIAKGHR